jgi:hypothetical protein
MSLTDADKTWIAEQFHEQETQTTERLQALENRMTERMRDVETSLLTEFHKWASPSAHASEPIQPRSGPLT